MWTSPTWMAMATPISMSLTSPNRDISLRAIFSGITTAMGRLQTTRQIWGWTMVVGAGGQSLSTWTMTAKWRSWRSTALSLLVLGITGFSWGRWRLRRVLSLRMHATGHLLAMIASPAMSVRDFL